MLSDFQKARRILPWKTQKKSLRCAKSRSCGRSDDELHEHTEDVELLSIL